MNEVEMETIAFEDQLSVESSVLDDAEQLDLEGVYKEYVVTEEAVTLLTTGTVEEKPSRTDNILTLGLVALLALVVIIAVIRKAISNKRPAPVVVEEIPEAPSVEAPGSAGKLKLYDTDPKAAAMVMAIVADKLQKPLNELHFVSIKEVK